MEARHHKQMVTTDEQFDFMMRTIVHPAIRHVAVDVETSGDKDKDGLNPWAGYLVGVGIAVAKELNGNSYAFYLPMRVDYPGYTGKVWTNDDLRAVLYQVDPRSLWWMHNAKFDTEWLEQATGYRWEVGTLHDPMLQMFLTGKDVSLGLKELTNYFFPHDPEPVKFSSLLGTGKKKKKLEQLDPNVVGDYCMADVINTLRIGYHTHALMEAEGQGSLYEKVELPILRILTDAEMRGVKIDQNALDKLTVDLHERYDYVEKQLKDFADINWNSPQQVVALCEKLRIHLHPELTPTGKQKMNEGILLLAKDQHYIISLLLEYKGLNKLINTYIKALYDKSDSDYRVHCQFRQTVARTGRLSCGDPNLQNIPSPDKEKGIASIDDAYKRLRSLFIGEPHLFQADLSQIELRMATHFSQDTTLVNAYKSGSDMHQATADQVCDGNRKLAKTVNFGWLFGQQAPKLAVTANITLPQAQRAHARFNKTFEGLVGWSERQKAKARINGYAETIMGRRRYIPNLKSNSWYKRLEAERQAISTIIQGSAADYLKVAMINLVKALEPRGVYLVLTVHDEVLFDTDEPLTPAEEKEIMGIIQYEMSHALPLNIPVEAEPKIVQNWAQAK